MWCTRHLRDDSCGQINSLPLGDGFTFQERLDFSGHKSGRVDPHINAEVFDSNGNVISFTRDLANNQLPGFNRMQDPWGRTPVDVFGRG